MEHFRDRGEGINLTGEKRPMCGEEATSNSAMFAKPSVTIRTDYRITDVITDVSCCFAL